MKEAASNTMNASHESNPNDGNDYDSRNTRNSLVAYPPTAPNVPLDWRNRAPPSYMHPASFVQPMNHFSRIGHDSYQAATLQLQHHPLGPTGNQNLSSLMFESHVHFSHPNSRQNQNQQQPKITTPFHVEWMQEQTHTRSSTANRAAPMLNELSSSHPGPQGNESHHLDHQQFDPFSHDVNVLQKIWAMEDNEILDISMMISNSAMPSHVVEGHVTREDAPVSDEFQADVKEIKDAPAPTETKDPPAKGSEANVMSDPTQSPNNWGRIHSTSPKTEKTEVGDVFNQKKQELMDNHSKICSDLGLLWSRFDSIFQSADGKRSKSDQGETFSKFLMENHTIKISLDARGALDNERKKYLHAKTLNDVENLHKKVFAEVYLLQRAISTGKQYLDGRTDEYSGRTRKEIEHLSQLVLKIEGKRTCLKDAIQNLEREILGSTVNNLSVPKAQTVMEPPTKKAAADVVVTHGAGKMNIGKRRKRNVTTSKKQKKVKKTRPSFSMPPISAIGKVKDNHGPQATILDRKPDRLVNPLLELPQPSSMSLEALPVAEYLKLMEIYYPEPDTFPLSFYERLLGIMEENEAEREVVSDPWMSMPALGQYARVAGRVNDPTLDHVDTFGSRRKDHLDYVDPAWIALLNEGSGYKDEYLRQPACFNIPCEISNECLALARKKQIINDTISFKFLTRNDISALVQFVKVSLYFYYSVTLLLQQCLSYLHLLILE